MDRLRFIVAFLLMATRLAAWGPHPEITQAALNVLDRDHPLFQKLQEQSLRLTNLCWLPDYRRLPFQEPDQDFYVNDFLLFPGFPTHVDHICPEVKKAYEPYFKRALQALRTETAVNAARWVGALLHFVEDSGSPPHAAEIRGGIHSSMENWVDSAQISIPGYRPRLLGTNDSDALAGFLRRMDGLIAFSRTRGLKLKLPIEMGNRAEVRPIVLESALETSRVTADLLHTLGIISVLTTTDSGTINGRLRAELSPGIERFPAKVMLDGTPYSTLADGNGNFQFRHLPPGDYGLIFVQPGNAFSNGAVEVRPGKTNVIEVRPKRGPGNLIRNGDFKLSWTAEGVPEFWTATAAGWEGEVMPLRNGQRYALRANFRNEGKGDVIVRWSRALPPGLPNLRAVPKIESRPLNRDDNELNFTGTANMALLQVIVRSKPLPGSALESVTLLALPAQGVSPGAGK